MSKWCYGIWFRMLKERRKTKHKYFCQKCLDRNHIKQCECGKCNEIIFLRDKKSRIMRFKKSHDKKGKPNLFIKRGIESDKWKFGRKKYYNYWMIFLPDYFSSRIGGYVLEHIYVFQEYHQCCMLPWGVVHHIIPISEGYCNNMPWNLMGMMWGKHTSLHKHLIYFTLDEV